MNKWHKNVIYFLWQTKRTGLLCFFCKNCMASLSFLSSVCLEPCFLLVYLLDFEFFWLSPGFLCLSKKLSFRPQRWCWVQLFCNITTKKVLLNQILGKFAVLIIKINFKVKNSRYCYWGLTLTSLEAVLPPKSGLWGRMSHFL